MHKRTPYNRINRKDNPVRYLLSQAKYRAKKSGLEFDLEYEDLIIPDRCPIMDIPLYFNPGRRGPNSYSIDRVDNEKGYIKDNVRVISFLANGRKGDLTLQQVEKLLAYMRGEI